MSLWALVACGGPIVAERVAPVTATAGVAWDVLIDEAGPVRVETVVSARWSVPLSGVLDLEDPRAAALEDGPHPIVLPVTTFEHPARGLFVVDSGVDADLAGGGSGPVRGVLRLAVGSMEPVEPLAAIVARSDQPLAAVLLTHAHLDHVLGLPDVPDGTPIYAGAGELRGGGLMASLSRGTLRAAFDGLTLSVLDPGEAVPLHPGLVGWDLLGDGSIWALAVPGHTPGSTAYLARTPDGPVLAVGDTSHTWWGWEHGVAPGTYTEDPAANRESLRVLRALADAHPTMRVLVGHELTPTEPAVAER